MTVIASPPPTTVAPPATPIGLTSAEVQERVARGQTNNFKPRVARTYWDIVRDNIFNLFNLVMFTLLIIVLLLGDIPTFLFAGFSVFTNALLGMVQEIAAKRQLDKLAALSTPAVQVWRDGALKPVSVYDIVVDDVLPLEPGDKIVVDGRVLHADSLEIDESQLTGESDAVLKEIDHALHSGSFAIAGSGTMVATTVGKDSTINKLSTIAKTYKRVLTPTQQRLNLIVQLSVIIMLLCAPMIFVAGFVDPVQAGSTTGSDLLLSTFRNAVVFVASIVPQGLVLTATLSLTIGAISLSRKQTLVQRVNAVESMANVNVLCFDKTGTLTMNLLTVSEVLPQNGATDESVRNDLALYLNNLASLNRTAAAVASYVVGSEQRTTPAIAKTREVPFTSSRKWGAVVLPSRSLVMGAPERVLGDGEGALRTQAATLAAQGLRVLAFAECADFTDGSLPGDRSALALIVLTDRVRENIEETLKAFQDEGVTLKVISGDNLETVREIASTAGMFINCAYTGDQLVSMDEASFRRAAVDGDLFARIEPDTKRRLVAALKEEGYYVAMTGDGVNDVPALKEAHLAIVMNDGAQISKDVADIVLLNNALSTMPAALHEGKLITQTIFATSKIFLVKNFYSLLFFVFAGFMALPFPINPIQISWVTFGVINIPATLIAFRIFKPEYMRYFRRDVFDYVLTSGGIATAALSALYAIVFLTNEQDMTTARSANMMFIALWGILVFWNVHGVELYRPSTWRVHGRIVVVGIVLCAATILAPYLVPQWLAFIPPSLADWAIVLVTFLMASVLLFITMQTRAFANLIWRLTGGP